MSKTAKKMLALLAVILVISPFCFTPSLAYLYDYTPEPVDNRFDAPAPAIDTELDETFDGRNKTIHAQNPDVPGAVSQYVRVVAVPYYRDGQGDYPCEVAYSSSGHITVIPPGGTAIELAPGMGSDWFYHDGAFYYKGMLPPGRTTASALVLAGSGGGADGWENLKVDVLLEAAEATPDAVTALWGGAVRVNEQLQLEAV